MIVRTVGPTGEDGITLCRKWVRFPSVHLFFKFRKKKMKYNFQKMSLSSEKVTIKTLEKYLQTGIAAFIWRETPEGLDFWNEQNLGGMPTQLQRNRVNDMISQLKTEEKLKELGYTLHDGLIEPALKCGRIYSYVISRSGLIAEEYSISSGVRYDPPMWNKISPKYIIAYKEMPSFQKGSRIKLFNSKQVYILDRLKTYTIKKISLAFVTTECGENIPKIFVKSASFPKPIKIIPDVWYNYTKEVAEAVKDKKVLFQSNLTEINIPSKPPLHCKDDWKTARILLPTRKPQIPSTHKFTEKYLINDEQTSYYWETERKEKQEQVDNKWIKHTTNEMPVDPDTIVVVKLSDGSTFKPRHAESWKNSWKHVGNIYGVKEYKIIKTPSPTETKPDTSSTPKERKMKPDSKDHFAGTPVRVLKTHPNKVLKYTVYTDEDKEYRTDAIPKELKKRPILSTLKITCWLISLVTTKPLCYLWLKPYKNIGSFAWNKIGPVVKYSFAIASGVAGAGYLANRFGGDLMENTMTIVKQVVETL